MCNTAIWRGLIYKMSFHMSSPPNKYTCYPKPCQVVVDSMVVGAMVNVWTLKNKHLNRVSDRDQVWMGVWLFAPFFNKKSFFLLLLWWADFEKSWVWQKGVQGVTAILQKNPKKMCHSWEPDREIFGINEENKWGPTYCHIIHILLWYISWVPCTWKDTPGLLPPLWPGGHCFTC